MTVLVEKRKRAHARERLAAALNALYADTEESLEESLRMTVEAGNIIREALRDRLKSNVLDG